MVKSILSILVVVLVWGSTVASAQTSNSSIFRFLEITPSAEAAALGGNHVALFNASPSVSQLNPAFLSPESSKSVSATFVNYLADSRIGFANFAYDVPAIGTLGFGIRYAGYGDLDRLDENGNNLGSFNAGDLSISTALSTRLAEKLTAGVGVDYIYSSYDVYKSSAVTGSAGVYYLDVETKFSAGVSIRNLGDQLSTYNGTREDIPFDISAGISKKPEKFPFHLNLTLQRLNDWDLRVFGEDETPDFGNNLFRHVIIGGEASFGENFRLRLGYNRYAHEQAKVSDDFDFAGASIGVGMNIKGIIVDISRNSLSDIGGVVQMSVRSQID